MDNGIASQVVQDIFLHAELMGVREKISKKKLEGTEIAARLKEAKNLTAGQIFTAGTTQLGKDVFSALQEKINKKRRKTGRKKMKRKKSIS